MNMNEPSNEKNRQNKLGTMKQSVAPFAWIDEIGEGRTKLSKNPSLMHDISTYICGLLVVTT